MQVTTPNVTDTSPVAQVMPVNKPLADFDALCQQYPALAAIEQRLLRGPGPTDSMPECSRELNRIARDPAREILGEGDELDVTMAWFQDLWSTRLAIQAGITRLSPFSR